ncbi:unnamed protein product [Kluyveromyces dobzhanskii CBS 2104]|uniref:WGS project CCBQ000000000 data, contig 00107 n=1 Tax=Kluyveromyces dobzhanskii CBS 2104 TaxID=1427455 RepID=A0A0A8L0W5_9SACH|nr:unnamed protein product [Kluyveromyces dobzhanskii CBS 2104]
MVFYSFIIRKISNKVFGDIKVGEGEDPYFEEVTFVKRSFWTGSSQVIHKKQAKAIPEYIPFSDRQVLQKVRKRAYRLDMMFKVFGVRIGWLGIIGLLPVIGDIVCLFLSWTVYNEARKIQGGLPVPLQAELLGNICVDFLLGLIPIVGDIVGIAYKANSRNTLVLEQHLRKKYGPVSTAVGLNSVNAPLDPLDPTAAKALKST